eukprot:5515959-Pleurochrysis_carterae.AAC.1
MDNCHRFRRSGRRTPRKVGFAEVDFRGGHDAVLGWHPDVIGSGRPGAPSEVHAYPCAYLQARLGVSASRFYGEGPTTKGQYTHDAWFFPHQQLVGGERGVRWAGCSV